MCMYVALHELICTVCMQVPAGACGGLKWVSGPLRFWEPNPNSWQEQ